MGLKQTKNDTKIVLNYSKYTPIMDNFWAMAGKTGLADLSISLETGRLT